MTLSEVSGEDVIVRWTTIPSNSLDPRARRGKDYWEMQGEIEISAGEISGTGVVWLKQDTEDEPDEVFSVEIFSPAGATIGRQAATMTIIDDD